MADHLGLTVSIDAMHNLSKINVRVCGTASINAGEFDQTDIRFYQSLQPQKPPFRSLRLASSHTYMEGFSSLPWAIPAPCLRFAQSARR